MFIFHETKLKTKCHCITLNNYKLHEQKSSPRRDSFVVNAAKIKFLPAWHERQ